MSFDEIAAAVAKHGWTLRRGEKNPDVLVGCRVAKDGSDWRIYFTDPVQLLDRAKRRAPSTRERDPET